MRAPGLFLALAIWLLCGCTETRSERQVDTEKRDTFTVSGSAQVPGFGSVPVTLTIDRNGSERLVEQSESKTQIDGAAIAQQVGAVVGKSLEAVVAKLTGLQPQATGNGFDSLLGLLGGTGGGAAIAYAIKEALARRRLEADHVEVKKDRDDIWERALDLAKQLPPKAGA